MEDPLPETLVTPPLGVSLANVTIRRRRNKRRRFGLHGSPPENFTEEDQAIIQHFDFAQCQDEEISWLEDKENCPVGGNNTRDSKEVLYCEMPIGSLLTMTREWFASVASQRTANARSAQPRRDC